MRYWNANCPALTIADFDTVGRPDVRFITGSEAVLLDAAMQARRAKDEGWLGCLGTGPYGRVCRVLDAHDSLMLAAKARGE